MPRITENDVIATANFIAQNAMKRLEDDARTADVRGYHRYATALTNMRSKIDKSLSELVDEVMKISETFWEE